MQLTVLIDNAEGLDPALHHEHGLSLYVEADGMRLLLDTGLSGRAMDNAAQLGIDITKVDALVLSHGHIDHTGGLQAFLRQNASARVYLSAEVRGCSYSSDRRGHWHDLSPRASLFDGYAHRLCWIGEECVALTSFVHIVRCRDYGKGRPSGNKYLHVGERMALQPYEACDELALAVTVSSGIVVMSPCSHNGLLNIIESCAQALGARRVTAFVGGLHLLDEETSADHVDQIARAVAAEHPGLSILTGHCTGSKACQTLREVLGTRVTVFRTGDVFDLK